MNHTARSSRRSVIHSLSALLSATVLLFTTGCSLVPAPKADPTRYYVLTAQPVDAELGTKVEGALVLGMKRIEIASYLNGKDIVVRTADNEIAYNSFSRWAESLSTSIGRVVAGSLASSEKITRVYPQPFPFDATRDYDVAIRVISCEGERKAGGKAVASFSALVEVTEAKSGGAVIWRKLFTAPETEWDGKDYGALAAALSEGAGALGDEIIAALPAK